MPEGLTKAQPAAFQRFMNDIFVDMIDVIVIIYMDEIPSISDNISKQKAQCLGSTHDSALTDFLPVQTNASSTSLPANTSATCCSRRPHHGPIQGPYYPRLAQTSESQGCSILPRFANFYCHFIYRYSEITVPLTHLTARVPPGTFPMSAVQPLKHLKRLSLQLQSLPIGSQTPKSVETDASDYALALFLSITTPNGELHPIAFHSQTFSAPELNYDVHDKSYLRFLKLSNDGDITSKALDFRSMWSLIIGICNTFQQPKSSRH